MWWLSLNWGQQGPPRPLWNTWKCIRRWEACRICALIVLEKAQGYCESGTSGSLLYCLANAQPPHTLEVVGPETGVLRPYPCW